MNNPNSGASIICKYFSKDCFMVFTTNKLNGLRSGNVFPARFSVLLFSPLFREYKFIDVKSGRPSETVSLQELFKCGFNHFSMDVIAVIFAFC
jgi:hypothetical protein